MPRLFPDSPPAGALSSTRRNLHASPAKSHPLLISGQGLPPRLSPSRLRTLSRPGEEVPAPAGHWAPSPQPLRHPASAQADLGQRLTCAAAPPSPAGLSAAHGDRERRRASARAKRHAWRPPPPHGPSRAAAVPWCHARLWWPLPASLPDACHRQQPPPHLLISDTTAANSSS